MDYSRPKKYQDELDKILPPVFMKFSHYFKTKFPGLGIIPVATGAERERQYSPTKKKRNVATYLVLLLYYRA